MAIVTSYDWESDTFTQHAGDNAARQAWRARAVVAVAGKAQAKLPECSGRVDSAVKLVLAGDVGVLARWYSQGGSHSQRQYGVLIVNGHCDWGFAKAPHSFCKHRLGAAIARRARELVTAQAETSAPDTTMEPGPAPDGAHGPARGQKRAPPRGPGVDHAESHPARP